MRAPRVTRVRKLRFLTGMARGRDGGRRYGKPLILLPIRACQYRAPVAQLDRVPGYEPGGREFESLRARQYSKTLGSAMAQAGQQGSRSALFRAVVSLRN